MKKVLFVFAVITLISAVTFAQTKTPQINKTQKNQVERIKDGVKKGELTKQETKTLVKEQKHIQKEKIAAKADGKITKAERKHIAKDQAKASKDIAVKKNNSREKK